MACLPAHFPPVHSRRRRLLHRLSARQPIYRLPTSCSYQPSIHPCADSLPWWWDRSGGRSALTSASAAAIATRSRGPATLAIRYAATVYKDRRAATAGDCDFFHNVSSTCLFLLRAFVNRRFPQRKTLGLDSATSDCGGKDQISKLA